MTKPHTPTPWRVDRDAHSAKEEAFVMGLEDDNARTIASCDTSHDHEEDVANAAFIVQACNSHYVLVKALKTITGEHYESAQYARDVARAALARATGRE